MIFPLADAPPKAIPATRNLGAPRPTKAPTRRHTGIDLNAPSGTPVVAPEGGKVVRHMGWSGNTAALWLAGPSGLWLFGAINADGRAPVGTQVSAGETIATVGTYPGGTEQLHLELWTPTISTAKRPIWELDGPPPPELLDPWPAISGSPPPTIAKSSGDGGDLLVAAGLFAGIAFLLARR